MYMDKPLNIYDKRLLKLAAFLRTEVPENLLDMHHWMTRDDNGHRHQRANLKCGTPACAAGWATHIFPELTYNWMVGGLILNGKAKGDDDNTLITLKKFFNYTFETDEYHIFGGEKRTPQQEADLIEKYVNERRFKRNGNGKL